MTALPAGTVTLLFTDIEGSTRLLRHLGDRYAEVITHHHRLLRGAFGARDGREIRSQGDAFFVVFPRASDAVTAAVAAQRAVMQHSWPADAAVRVRMGLHTGEPLIGETGYEGMAVHRAARICAAAHGGQILLSRATHELIADDLQSGMSFRDLGEHRLKDLAQPDRIFQVVAADLPADFPPLETTGSHPNNLPRRLTSFVGRGREIAEINRLLSTTSLLTLTGSGGAGKTRLALEVAARLLDRYPDGVWFVELAALTDPALVPVEVASSIGVQERPGRDVNETLAHYLRSRSVLIVLDNCEHLMEACVRLADFTLRACPRLRIIATSREGLGIDGETLYRVPSLPAPDPDRLPPVGNLVEYEAVRLFAERAAAVVPSFRITEQNARAVAEACHRLDGIPLAIELAAARVQVLDTAQIVARLDDRFRLLTGGSRSALPRHQTLRAAVDWSYELLSEDERRLLSRLSVFVGGFTLEAAEAVCATEGAAPGEALDLLAHLVNKSLVTMEDRNGAARYRLLETIRQYARDKLGESGEEEEIRDLHSRWYLSFAERAEPELRGPQQTVWLARLDSDHDNFRSAVEWLASRANGEAALRLTTGLWRFWFTRGHLREGRGRLEEALARGAGIPPLLRMKALIAAGYLALNQEDYGAAATMLEECLAIGQRLGDRPESAVALNWLGVVAWRRGDFERAESLYARGLALASALGAEDVRIRMLNSLALVTASRGDFAVARELLEECVSAYRRKADKAGVALTTGNLAVMVFRLGDHAAARSIVMESLRLFCELGEVRGMASDLQLLGILAGMRSRPERAARILGAVEAVREAVGAPFAQTERVLYDYERYLAVIRGALTEDAFARAWAEGRGMRLEKAVEYARHDLEIDAAVDRAGHAGPP